MEEWQWNNLYINSFLKFSKTKHLKHENYYIDVHKYLLDRRFIRTTSIDELKLAFPKCKLKDSDEYWFIIYSPSFLNNKYVFNTLNNYRLLKSLNEFIEIVR